jgi:hypothetical protein
MKLLNKIWLVNLAISLNVLAAPIVVGTANSNDSLIYCYDQEVGNNSVRYTVGFFATGVSPNLTLWRNKQISNCSLDSTINAEPFARNLSNYNFTLKPNATSPKALEIELTFSGMSEPLNTTIMLRNLQ